MDLVFRLDLYRKFSPPFIMYFRACACFITISTACFPAISFRHSLVSGVNTAVDNMTLVGQWMGFAFSKRPNRVCDSMYNWRQKKFQFQYRCFLLDFRIPGDEQWPNTQLFWVLYTIFRALYFRDRLLWRNVTTMIQLMMWIESSEMW